MVGSITVSPLPLLPGQVATITVNDDDLDTKGTPQCLSVCGLTNMVSPGYFR